MADSKASFFDVSFSVLPHKRKVKNKESFCQYWFLDIKRYAADGK
jgi:hypothetical protein